MDGQHEQTDGFAFQACELRQWCVCSWWIHVSLSLSPLYYGEFRTQLISRLQKLSDHWPVLGTSTFCLNYASDSRGRICCAARGIDERIVLMQELQTNKWAEHGTWRGEWQSQQLSSHDDDDDDDQRVPLEHYVPFTTH